MSADPTPGSGVGCPLVIGVALTAVLAVVVLPADAAVYQAVER